jgi:hypothetical protein
MHSLPRNLKKASGQLQVQTLYSRGRQHRYLTGQEAAWAQIRSGRRVPAENRTTTLQSASLDTTLSSID